MGYRNAWATFVRVTEALLASYQLKRAFAPPSAQPYHSPGWPQFRAYPATRRRRPRPNDCSAVGVQIPRDEVLPVLWSAGSWMLTSCTWLQNKGSGFPFYITANCRFLRSVISIAPGACVIANGGLMCAMTDWGVTPQAQNTGSSSVLTSTGSP
jgi:hypothetical protein